MRTSPRLALALLLLLPACGDDGGGTAAAADVGDRVGDAAAGAGDPDTAAGSGDADADASAAGGGGDAGPDEVHVATPLPLMAGAATARLRLPVGVATVGLSPGQGPKTPYAEVYPGTDSQHSDLDVRALVLRNDQATVVLARIDAIGTWQDIVRDVAARLREAGHDDLAGGLIVSATHTHSSGGRAFDHFVGELAVGPFMPGLYKRMVDALVEAVLAADAAVVPARFGWTTLQTPLLHKDRRCENGDVQDDTMGLMKVESTDGDLLAVVVNYSMHGTVIGGDDYTLSSDSTGAVESGIAARLPDPAVVLYFQSWAGDMAPRTPDEYFTDDGFDLRWSYRDLTAIAAGAGELVVPALEGLETAAEVALDVLTVPIPLNGKVINPDGVFDEWEWGAIYCMSSDENCEADAQPYEYLNLTCVGVPEEYTVSWTQLSAARIGDLGLVTLPGEPLTSVGVELRASALAVMGLADVFVLGYSQSYLAYLLHPDDWWMGGYEGAGSLMGPGFGVYLIARATEIAAHLMDRSTPLPFEPPALEPFAPTDFPELEHEEALETPAVVAQPDGSLDVIEASWIGGDSAVDFPVVALESEVGGAWEAVTHPSGASLDSGGPEIELFFATDPTYSTIKHTDARVFTWTARLPRRFAVPPAMGQLQGTFRFAIRGDRPEPYELVTEPFVID